MTKKEMSEEGEMLVIRNFKLPLSIWNSLGKNSGCGFELRCGAVRLVDSGGDVFHPVVCEDFGFSAF
jgi:sulfatase maturation enzyme AslB (radical SAM superfamily)